VHEVREPRTKPRERARHRPRHAQLLRARRQHDRLDPLGDERCVARQRRDPKVAGERRHRAEQVLDVRLVARAAAAEEVGVEDDHSAAL
jgi:hypothetical protein